MRSGRGGLPRSLHRKLLSPDRRKKGPEELRQVAAEKQLRAERSRQQAEAERKAKLAKVGTHCVLAFLVLSSGVCMICCQLFHAC